LYFVTGWKIDLENFMQIGERIFTLKRMYNINCGISRKDDNLPPRILSHKRGEGGSKDHLPPLGEMLSQYYSYRNWNEIGIPTEEKLEELGLKNMVMPKQTKLP
ncbi:MAG: aldehyde ferredoxin oxidoreductase, partial [Actinobacteria bacterium]|nr:aldehyde ferredoxin oxidoreductase [Actinomycetota bacterium]